MLNSPNTPSALRLNHSQLVTKASEMEGSRILEVFSLSSTSSTLQLKDSSVYQGGERLFAASRQRRNNLRSVNRGNEPGETLLFDA